MPYDGRFQFKRLRESYGGYQREQDVSATFRGGAVYASICASICINSCTRHGVILDLVLSDNISLVAEVEMCEGLGNSDPNKVVFSITLKNKAKDNNILVTNFNQPDFDCIRHKLAQID